jgi:pimeloyl-ACP methyl ester carboxylesterase
VATIEINGVELYYEVHGTGETVVLTHGSWTDGSGWQQAVDTLKGRYRIVVWDRRGHSRSQGGDRPGSRAEDAADLAALIEHVSAEPVHLIGNSYGGNVTLTLLTARPELTVTAAVHEPPLWGLLEGERDPEVLDALTSADTEVTRVAELIRSGEHRRAARHFVERVALGPGMWDLLPEASRGVMEANAPTFLDELADETALCIDGSALASTDVPLLLTRGTTSSVLFPAALAELAQLAPAAQVGVIDGAGHVPHLTHTGEWAACVIAFHEQQAAQRSHARTP